MTKPLRVESSNYRAVRSRARDLLETDKASIDSAEVLTLVEREPKGGAAPLTLSDRACPERSRRECPNHISQTTRAVQMPNFRISVPRDIRYPACSSHLLLSWFLPRVILSSAESLNGLPVVEERRFERRVNRLIKSGLSAPVSQTRW